MSLDTNVLALIGGSIQVLTAKKSEEQAEIHCMKCTHKRSEASSYTLRVGKSGSWFTVYRLWFQRRSFKRLKVHTCTSPSDLYTRITNILRLCQVRSLGWYDVGMLNVAQRSPGPVIVPSEIVASLYKDRRFRTAWCWVYFCTLRRRVEG